MVVGEGEAEGLHDKEERIQRDVRNEKRGGKVVVDKGVGRSKNRK